MSLSDHNAKLILLTIGFLKTTQILVHDLVLSTVVNLDVARILAAVQRSVETIDDTVALRFLFLHEDLCTKSAPHRRFRIETSTAGSVTILPFSFVLLLSVAFGSHNFFDLIVIDVLR